MVDAFGTGPRYRRRMKRSPLSFVRDPRVQGAGDVLLAVVLAVSSVLPILVKGDPSWGHPKWLAVVLALLTSAPIAWRARWPLPVAAIILFANGACVYAAA